MTDGDREIAPGDAASEEQTEPISARVVDRVAAESGRAPTELSPLYESVDPDALDAVVESSETTISFAYAGQLVTIRGDETIETTPVEE